MQTVVMVFDGRTVQAEAHRAYVVRVYRVGPGAIWQPMSLN